MTETMFAQPAAGDMFEAKKYPGHLLLVENIGGVESVNTSLGATDAVRADVTVIDAPGGPEVFRGTLVFGRALVGTLARSSGTGQPVLARLGQGAAKPGQSAPWVLVDHTPTDAQMAAQYITARTAGQFQQAAPQYQAPQAPQVPQMQSQAPQQAPQVPQVPQPQYQAPQVPQVPQPQYQAPQVPQPAPPGLAQFPAVAAAAGYQPAPQQAPAGPPLAPEVQQLLGSALGAQVVDPNQPPF